MEGSLKSNHIDSQLLLRLHITFFKLWSVLCFVFPFCFFGRLDGYSIAYRDWLVQEGGFSYSSCCSPY
jgi:hypothetical protein